MNAFGSFLRPQLVNILTDHASLLGRVLEVAGKSRPRNVEQLRRAPLIAICLLVNEPYVPFHRTRQGEIGIWLFVVVRERTSVRSLACSRRLFGFEVRWENDMLWKNDRAITKQSHRSHGVT